MKIGENTGHLKIMSMNDSIQTNKAGTSFDII